MDMNLKKVLREEHDMAGRLAGNAIGRCMAAWLCLNLAGSWALCSSAGFSSHSLCSTQVFSSLEKPPECVLHGCREVSTQVSKDMAVH